MSLIERLSRRTSPAVRRWGGWFLMWAAGSLVLLSGRWGGDIHIAHDPSSYFFQVFRTLEGGGLPWRGYYSHIEYGHPGPVMFWVLILGGWVGRLLGVSPVSGGVVLYGVICAFLITLTAWLVARATKHLLAGMGVWVLTWLFVAKSTEISAGRPTGFLMAWPVYGPTFATMLLLPAVAAGAGAVQRDRACAWWSVALGGLAFQVFAPDMILAAFGLMAGVWCLWSTRSRGDAATGPTDAPRTPHAGTRGTLIQLTSALFVGYGSFLGRWVVEGGWFPLDYLRMTMRAEELLLEETTGRTESIAMLLAGPWLTQSWTVVAGLILTGLAICALVARRWAAYVLICGLVTYLILATQVRLQHHAVSIALFHPLALGAGAGVLLERLVRLLTRRAPVVTRVAMVLLATLGTAYALRVSLPVYKSLDMPTHAAGGAFPSQETEERKQVVQRLSDLVDARPGQLVGLVTTRPDGDFANPMFYTNELYELLDTLVIDGARVCVSGYNYRSQPRRAGPWFPRLCPSGPWAPKIWVVIADLDVKVSSSRSVLYPFAGGEHREIRLHVVDSPARAGLVQCPQMEGRWWPDPACRPPQ